MDTNLATIQVIKSLSSIPNADAIELAETMGWKVVVKKGDFRVGDKCVYCGIDTILPEKPEFEFLRKVHFRIKTIRLRKQLSQGIIFPLTILPTATYSEGQDVTTEVGITHYEKPVPVQLAALDRGDFPSSYVLKTDEIMVQNILPVLEELKGKEVYITVKCDGTSATFVNTGRNSEVDIHVCSRNLSLKETEGNIYWQMFHKYKLDEVLKIGHYAIQAELCGPGIQKNRLGLKEHQIFVFNVYDVDKGQYLNYSEMIKYCVAWNLPTVPIHSIYKFDFTLDQLLEMAKGTYESGQKREGIVIRPVEEMYSQFIDDHYGMRGRLSFKVLNNDYLEKDEE